MSAALPAELHGLICAQMADALIFSDCEGRIRLWNEAASALFGFRADEALGQSLDLIIPPALRDAHWKGFQRAIDGGQTRLGHRVLLTRAQGPDGQPIYVEMSFAIITDPDAGVVGAVAVARDGSTHREQAHALRNCLAALENRSAAAPQAAA